MKPRLRIPQYAKNEANEGLILRSKLPKSKKFGLSEDEAEKQGVKSGVVRAKQLINQESLSWEDAKSVARFHQRFKNKKSNRSEGAIQLWGGREFGKKAIAFVNYYKYIGVE